MAAWWKTLIFLYCIEIIFTTAVKTKIYWKEKETQGKFYS